MTRLEYSKLILKKICFDRNLLEKEYCKAMNLIGVNERSNLSEWCKAEFGAHVLHFSEIKNNQLKP